MSASFDEWAQDHRDDILPLIRALASDVDRAIAWEAMKLAFFGGWVRAVDREDHAMHQQKVAAVEGARDEARAAVRGLELKGG